MQLLTCLLIAGLATLSGAKPQPFPDADWELHKVLGKVSCSKDQSLVPEVKISLWLKAWDVFVPSFHECTNHPNATGLRYAMVHPGADGHFKISCAIDMSERGLTANFLQLFLQHHCTESGEPADRYFDVDFPTPFYVNQTIELFTVDRV